MSADIIKNNDICQELKTEMEYVDIDNWQAQIEHYRDVLRGSGVWIAVVDDVPHEALILKTLFECLELKVSNSSKVADGSKDKPDIVIHEFLSADDLPRYAGQYDLLVMDANFGPGTRSGPSVAKDIKSFYPDIIIIGRSGEPEMNRLFKKIPVDLVLPKEEEGDLLPNFGKILSLLEKHIEDQQDRLID